jgi:hypothetical protein
MWVPPTALARLSLLLALVPLSALAQDPVDETTRWVPSIGARSALIGQNAEASSSASNISYQRTRRVRELRPNPPPQFRERIVFENIDAPIRPSVDGEDVMLAPFVAGSVELMTPGLQMIPGKPRFFVRGDAGAAFGTERHIARERAPGPLPEGKLPGVPNLLVLDTGFIEDAVGGIGSETTAETQPLTIAAGAGIAFSFDAFGRRFRVKPSAEYLREEVDFTGIVSSAQLFDTGAQAADGITQKDSLFMPIQLRGSASEVFQGVGAGLELEMDTLRAGPFMITLFVGAQGVKLLGDTEVEFSDEQILVNPPLVTPLRPNNQPISAEWKFEKDPWMYSGGVGVRFRFIPE